jgi:hypothetical protein
MSLDQYVAKHGEHPLAEYERKYGSLNGWRVCAMINQTQWLGPSESQKDAFKRLKLMLEARPADLMRICVERVPT